MCKLIPAGRISKPYGTEGELVVNLYNEFPAELNLEEPLFVYIDKLAVPLFIEKFHRRGKSGAVVLLADIDTPARAAMLLGSEFYLPGQADSQTTHDDEFYPEQLVGFMAAINDGVTGKISGYIDSEYNPLFEVIVEGHEMLIPVVDEYIDYIDPTTKTVGFSIPEDLLSLNR